MPESFYAKLILQLHLITVTPGQEDYTWEGCPAVVSRPAQEWWSMGEAAAVDIKNITNNMISLS